MIKATVSTMPSRGATEITQVATINTVPLNFTLSQRGTESTPGRRQGGPHTFNFLLTRVETLCRATTEATWYIAELWSGNSKVVEMLPSLLPGEENLSPKSLQEGRKEVFFYSSTGSLVPDQSSGTDNYDTVQLKILWWLMRTVDNEKWDMIHVSFFKSNTVE